MTGAITPGELVAFYGYSAFLMIPLRTATEFANKLIRGPRRRRSACAGCSTSSRTSSSRSHRPTRPRRTPSSPMPGRACGSGPAPWSRSSASPPDEAAALADRLGLCAPEPDDDVTLGGVALTALPREEVRRRIVVSDTGATLFSGRLADRLALDERGLRRRLGPLDRASRPRRPTTSSTRCPSASTRT